MKMLLVVFLQLSGSYLLLAGPKEKPIWARSAVAIGECLGDAGHRISSPDVRLTLELRCHRAKRGEDPVPYLQFRTATGASEKVDLDPGAHEVVWAPDSTAFFVNGGTSAYAGFFATVYLVANNKVRKFDVSRAAQADMVKLFPPCKAANRDEHTCAEDTRHPQFNMSGLAWVHGSSQVIVMSEVPCSSSYGGIMCQVEGYEISVPSGMITKRLSSRELKSQWQRSMAWDMRIPDPPVYGRR